jgi:rare lipoprotein A (peptidoglycan hydrolase)
VAIRAAGRSVVVPVIDRGPYARGIAYDLTSATARGLGVTGTARIGAAVLNR